MFLFYSNLRDFLSRVKINEKVLLKHRVLVYLGLNAYEVIGLSLSWAKYKVPGWKFTFVFSALSTSKYCQA